MRYIAVLNGEIDVDVLEYINDETFIICADGGANYLYEKKIYPDLLMGDMDSINKESSEFFNNVDTKKFKCEKDETDGQLIIDEIIKNKPKDVIIIGALGKRFDHCLGNMQLLYRLCKNDVNAKFISKNEEVYMTKDTLVFEKQIGKTISVIPYSKNTVITLNGFKYEVNDFEFELDCPIGISNIIEKNYAKITVINGYATIILNK